MSQQLTALWIIMEYPNRQDIPLVQPQGIPRYPKTSSPSDDSAVAAVHPPQWAPRWAGALPCSSGRGHCGG